MKITQSLKFKLNLIILIVALIPLIIFAVLQHYQINSTITSNIRFQETQLAVLNAKQIESWVSSKVSQIDLLLKEYPEFKKMNRDEIMNIVKVINESDEEIENSVVADKDGNSINEQWKEISIADREHFIRAKASKKTEISNVLESRATGNRMISIAVPVLDDSGAFQGVIQSNVVVKALENSLGQLKVEKTGFVFLIAQDSELIFHPNAELVGKKVFDIATDEDTRKAYEKILSENEGFFEYTDSQGIEKVAAYCAVPSTGWRVVATAPSSEVYAKVNQINLISLIVIGLSLLIISLVSYFAAQSIINPIRIAADHFTILANADFSKELPKKVLRRTDEIGLLANAVNIMSNSFKSVLESVINETNDIKINILGSSKSISQLTMQIEDVSATTEQISAGMEEMAASAQEMNVTSTEIEGAVESIAVKAQNGSEIAREISRRAQELKNNAVISQKSAFDIHYTIDKDMRASIDETKAVDQIDILTQSILQITTQTNLLALNAAIEAARAGETGKGFAVVAEEIRKLAENSKNTINQIQNVTKQVVSSVQNLSFNSEKALNFIDSTVISDYKKMVETGEQYFKDAEAIQELIADFSNTARALNESMLSMTNAINEVTLSNNEGAQGTQNIAIKATEVMDGTVNITKLMKELEGNAERLVLKVGQFKLQ